MNITVLTLFPEFIEVYFNTSIMAKAVEKGIIRYRIVNIRDFATDKHRTCDDAPYGGGAGMVLKPEPLALALDSVEALTKHVVYPSPSGKVFDQPKAEDLSRYEDIVFICGRYEGIDQRIIDLYVDEELSIGDYVMASGELGAMVMIDSLFRLCEGVIAPESLEEESFQQGLLEYPLYTRPEVFRDLSVPEVLLSGHHENIDNWRLEQRRLKTKENRPDLLIEKPEPDL